jgi:hypothetical protein
MDILEFLVENESAILLVISVLLAIVARYFQNQSKILYDAGQAIVDLEQLFLADIKDGVISKEEIDLLVPKVEAAKAAILAVVEVFTQPVTFSQRLDILLGSTGARNKIAQIQIKTQTMQMKRR